VSIGPLSEALMGAYISQVPSPEGLFRLSYDVVVTQTDTTCQANGTDQGTLAADPQATAAKCPGYVGQINGKLSCVGTAAAPLPSPSGEGLGEAERQSINKSDSGNPAAGPKPETGVGSGNTGSTRTPSEGIGTALGGPVGASANSTKNGDGTTTKPVEGKEQQNCGAPGQPQCKIDETGTPTPFGADKYSSSLDAAKSESDSARNTIGGTADKGFFESFRSSLTSAPPIVGCTAIELPKEMGAINPCPVVDGVRAVMAYMWAAAALFLCFRMIKQVI